MRLFSILLLTFLVGGCANQTSNVVALDAQRMSEVDRVINDAIERKNIPGAVLLVERGGQNLYFKSYGNRAVQPAAVAMSNDTIFDIASLSKPVGCATSIMILAERGKLKVSDAVSRY